MNYDTVEAAEFGRSLTGIGLNLLVRDVTVQISFLETVFELKAHQPSKDFAIISYGSQLFQLHSDGTYHSNPLLGLVPEMPPLGSSAISLRSQSAKARALGLCSAWADSSR